MQTTMPQHSRRGATQSLLSLTHPNRELFFRQRAMLRRAVPAVMSLASGYAEQCNSPGEYPLKYSETIFFMRMAGDSMRGLGIFAGDLLVVDRALPAMSECIVIAVVGGELAVRQLLGSADGWVLRTAGHVEQAEKEFVIWGVVSWKVHKCNYPKQLLARVEANEVVLSR